MIRIIYYDITENKPRTKLADLLEHHGFERMQYSVFVGKVSSVHWKKLLKLLQQFFQNHCLETDRIYSHVIDRDDFQKMIILGEPLDKAWILHEVKVLFF